MKNIVVLVILALLVCVVLGALHVPPFAAVWDRLFAALTVSAIVASAQPKNKRESRIKERTREQVLAQDSGSVVAGLDDRARSGVDAAKAGALDAIMGGPPRRDPSHDNR